MADRKRFAEAIKILNGESESLVDFTYCKPLSVEEKLPKAISFEELGEIQIPVSLKDIERLKTISEKSKFGEGFNSTFNPSLNKSLEIGSEKLISTSLDFDLIASLIVNQLGLPVEFFDLEVKLDKVILYETEGHYKPVLNSNNGNSIFGTVILQIPVEGGHEGGMFTVEYKGETEKFENNENSHLNFYFSAFYNECKHSMEPVTSGFKLTAVFNLVWKNMKSEIPQNIPSFLSAMKEMKGALFPWIEANNRPAVIINHRCDCKCVDLKDDVTDRVNVHVYEKACEDVLYFVLEEKYSSRKMTFQRLLGKDRQLANFLQNCKFLDVHLALAVVKKTITRQYDLTTAKVSRWMDSNNTLINFGLQLDWFYQCVGPMRKLLSAEEELIPDYHKFLEREICAAEGESFEIQQDYYHHYMLVVWPKKRSFQMYCRHGMHSVLELLERPLDSNLSSPLLKDVINQDPKQLLRNVVDFCYNEPDNAWRDRNLNRWVWELGLKEGELTSRLLRLCTTMKARDEGLLLLQVIGSVDREGIKTGQVAYEIAKFQSQVAGWTDCAPLIERLATRRYIRRQLVQFLQLAMYFVDVNCIVGATMVAQRVSAVLLNLDQSWTLGFAELEVCIDRCFKNEEMITSPEMESLAATLDKIKSAFTALVTQQKDEYLKVLANAKEENREKILSRFTSWLEVMIKTKQKFPSSDGQSLREILSAERY